eukprot:UN2405
MTIIPAHAIFSDVYTRALPMLSQALGRLPFYLVPTKKYSFKTPAPLPPPSKEHRSKGRSRCRLSHTFWCVHGGSDRKLHERLLSLARRNIALGDCTVFADVLELPRDVVPTKFNDEMRRNAELPELPRGLGAA